jgi:hypothetical protein
MSASSRACSRFETNTKGMLVNGRRIQEKAAGPVVAYRAVWSPPSLRACCSVKNVHFRELNTSAGKVPFSVTCPVMPW